MENKRDLSKKHLRDQAKRAKDIGKRTREAKSKEPAHHVDATGEDDVTQTQISLVLVVQESSRHLSADLNKD